MREGVGGPDWDPYGRALMGTLPLNTPGESSPTKEVSAMSKDRTKDPTQPKGKPVEKPRGKDGKFLPTADKPQEPVGDLVEQAEIVAAQLMKARDKKLKATGAKIALAGKTFRKQNPEKDNVQALNPEIIDVVGRYLTDGVQIYGVNGGKAATDHIAGFVKNLAQKHGASGDELLKAMGAVCPGCEKLAEALKRKEPAL
jgi:hypothetical protein